MTELFSQKVWMKIAVRHARVISHQADAIERVRELHEQVPCTEEGECCQICDYCGYKYPCETIKALDGEQG